MSCPSPHVFYSQTSENYLRSTMPQVRLNFLISVHKDITDSLDVLTSPNLSLWQMIANKATDPNVGNVCLSKLLIELPSG